ncbi:MAG: ribosome silencing factor [Clostridia bacterium]|nr:ribosome silencing factor [Clostridia bacterium]
MNNRFGETEVKQLCEILCGKKALDVVAIHVGDRTIVADWFVIASGHSTIQVKALCDELEEKSAELELTVNRKEGYAEGRWIVLDYGFILVHIFHPEERAYYNMERLWEDGENMIRFE